MLYTNNLLNHQNVSKKYENDCPKNFVSLFMPSVQALIVENSQFLAGVYITFLGKRPIPDLKGFQVFNAKFES